MSHLNLIISTSNNVVSLVLPTSSSIDVTIESQKISYESFQEKHQTLINIKNSEIERLSAIAVNQSDYSKWWATGGVVVGIILTVAVVYAVNPEGR